VQTATGGLVIERERESRFGIVERERKGSPPLKPAKLGSEGRENEPTHFDCIDLYI
jgi:hypothetical protein